MSLSIRTPEMENMSTRGGDHWCISPDKRGSGLHPFSPDGIAVPSRMLTLVRCEENGSLVSSDWPRSGTQEGGCEEGWGGRRARMVRHGSGERWGVTEEGGGGGERWGMDWDGGGQRGRCWSEGRRDEGGGEGRLHQLLLRTQGEEQWKQGRTNNKTIS